MRLLKITVPTVLALASCVLCLAGEALAYDFTIKARTEGYGYQLRRYDRGGIVFVNRRRITQYLQLRIFNLLDDGRDPFAPGKSSDAPALLTFHALMRFGTDFGAYIDDLGTIKELRNNQFDLLLGTLEGRNLFGRLDFTLGRQYDMELLDFFAFDGLRVRVKLPWNLFAESHAGIQAIRAHPLSAAVFETDGATGDGTDDALAPTFGLAAGWEWDPWLSLRVAYRHTLSSAPRAPVSNKNIWATDQQHTEDIWATDQELFFLGFSAQAPRIHTRMVFGMRYNLITAQLDDLQILLRQRLFRRHEIRAEYLHARPHFDGDSIFNIFGVEPYDEATLGYNVRILTPLDVFVRLGYRRLWTSDDGLDSGEPDALSAGAGLSWRTTRVRAAGEFFYLGGHGGQTIGGDLSASWSLLRVLTVEGRLSLVDFQGRSYVSANGLNFGFTVGAKARFIPGILLHVMLEDNINPLYKSALRLMAVLELEFAS